MKISKILIGILCLLSLSGAYAQQTDSFSPLALSIWAPEDDDLPSDAQRVLFNKLSQIASRQGIAADPGYSRFIFTAHATVTEKFITPTAPPKHAYKMDVTFYIGDGFDGKIFASYNTPVTGVGDNETKAFLDAFKNIQVANPNYKKFVEQGKAKIIAYYNDKCDAIIRESKSLTAAQQHDEAIYLLMSIPEECKACYQKALDAVDAVYQQKIDREGKILLAEANTVWNVEQTAEGARKAGELLVQIDPNANNFNEALRLSQKLAERVKALDDRDRTLEREELAFQRKMMEREQTLRFAAVEKSEALERERIRAYREIQKAYAENQPEVQYVHLW